MFPFDDVIMLNAGGKAKDNAYTGIQSTVPIVNRVLKHTRLYVDFAWFTGVAEH